MFKEFSNVHTFRRPLLRWLLVLLAVIPIAIILMTLYRNDEQSPSQETAQEMKPDAPLVDQDKIRKQLEVLATSEAVVPASAPNQDDIQRQLETLAKKSQAAATASAQEDIRAQMDVLSQKNK